MSTPRLEALINRLIKEFGGPTELQNMMFVTYKGKLNTKKEISIMKDFPEYRFYFICKGEK